MYISQCVCNQRSPQEDTQFIHQVNNYILPYPVIIKFNVHTLQLVMNIIRNLDSNKHELTYNVLIQIYLYLYSVHMYCIYAQFLYYNIIHLFLSVVVISDASLWGTKATWTVKGNVYRQCMSLKDVGEHDISIFKDHYNCPLNINWSIFFCFVSDQRRPKTLAMLL